MLSRALAPLLLLALIGCSGDPPTEPPSSPTTTAPATFAEALEVYCPAERELLEGMLGPFAELTPERLRDEVDALADRFAAAAEALEEAGEPAIAVTVSRIRDALEAWVAAIRIQSSGDELAARSAAAAALEDVPGDLCL